MISTLAFLSVLLPGGVIGALTGSQKISTHYYEEQAADLEGSPTFCGYKGSQMTLSRVTAVAGLAQSECGTCLEITGGSSTVYAMAVDLGGIGLDLNKSQFKQLFGEETGLFQASWKPTSDSNCAGVLRGASPNTQQSGSTNTQQSESTNTQQPEPNNTQQSDSNNTQQPGQYDPNSQQSDQNPMQSNPQQPGQSPQQPNNQPSPMDQSQPGQNTQQSPMDQSQPGQITQQSPMDQSQAGQNPQQPPMGQTQPGASQPANPYSINQQRFPTQYSSAQQRSPDHYSIRQKPSSNPVQNYSPYNYRPAYF